MTKLELLLAKRVTEVTETLKQRDQFLEALWAELEDVPFHEVENGKMLLAEPYLHFPTGTEREDIWHWFDQRHSKGIVWLLYHVDHTNSNLIRRWEGCQECMSDCCAFNPEGICTFPLVYGRQPEINDSDGCLDCLIRREEIEKPL